MDEEPLVRVYADFRGCIGASEIWRQCRDRLLPDGCSADPL